LAMVELYRQEGLEGTFDKYEETLDLEISRRSGARPAARTLRETRSSCDKWKTKALARQSEIDKMQVKIRDLEKSRDKWKEKAIEAKEENQELKKLSRLKTVEGKKKTSVSG